MQLDFKQLLEPIAGESSVGCYLKGDRTVYRSLRNTFNSAQSSFRRLIETPDSSSDEALYEENQKNWQDVNDTCWQALTEKSKDVEIVCWWIMSLAFQQNSITKISAALELLPPFFEKFWPDVQPFLPEDKLKATSPEELASLRAEFQLKPIIQLLGESTASGLLYMPLQMLSLVGEVDHSQYLSASKSGKLAELKILVKKDFPKLQSGITDTILALNLAIESLNSLDVWLKKTTASLSISVISAQFLRSNLSDCLMAIKHLVGDSYSVWPLDQVSPIVKDMPQNNNTSIADQVTDSSAIVQAALQTTSIQQPSSFTTQVNLANRDQAFQELRKIADYFSKSEPHSPVSFLLEKAIRWGYMSLPELMQELMKGNDNVLAQVNLITGIDGEKADISAHVPTAPNKPQVQQSELKMNNSTEPQISAINETVSNTAPTLTPRTSSSETQQDIETKTSSPSDDFNW